MTISGRSPWRSARSAACDAGVGGARQFHRRTCGAAWLSSLPANMLLDMAVQVPAQRPVGEDVPLPAASAYHWRIEASSYSRSTGHSMNTGPGTPDCGQREGLGHRGAELAHAADLEEALDVRLDQRALVDVLQRAAALQRGGRGAADQDHRRLRQLRVLQRGDGVGDAGPGGDRGHARPARQPRGGIGGEDGGDLVAHVDDADAARLGALRIGEMWPPHSVKMQRTPCACSTSATRSPPWRRRRSRAAHPCSTCLPAGSGPDHRALAAAYQPSDLRRDRAPSMRLRLIFIVGVRQPFSMVQGSRATTIICSRS